MPDTFKTLEIGTIAAGDSAEATWTPNKNITISKILIVETDDKSLSNVKFYLSLAGQTYTIPYVPASLIGSDPEYCYKPNLQVAQGTQIYVKLENDRADSVTLRVVFVYQ